MQTNTLEVTNGQGGGELVQATTKAKRLGALAVMGQRFNVDPAKLLETLKNTAFKGATDDECMALAIIVNEYNLNPFRKEIYAFPAKGGGITPVMGVDGWLRIMNSSANFDGIEFEITDDAKGKPATCTAIIHVKGRARPVRVTEYFEECQRGTDNWTKMPRRMLRNRAICQGVRIAFGVGGIMEEDEAEAMMDPVANAKPVLGTVSKPELKQIEHAPKETSFRPQIVREEVKAATPAPFNLETPDAPATPKRGIKLQILIDWMERQGCTWAQLQPILVKEDVLPGADSIGTVDELNEAQAAKIHLHRLGLEAEIAAQGGAK